MRVIGDRKVASDSSSVYSTNVVAAQPKKGVKNVLHAAKILRNLKNCGDIRQWLQGVVYGIIEKKCFSRFCSYFNKHFLPQAGGPGGMNFDIDLENSQTSSVCVVDRERF